MQLLAAHSGLEIAWATSSTRVGQPVSETVQGAPAGLRFEDATPALLDKAPVDAVILALPNGESAAWVEAASADVCLIDLSSDHRFDASWVYGLAQRHRAILRGAHRIANPGCYATAMQAAIAPMVPLLDGPVHAFGVSGTSGAGTSPSPKNDPELLRDNLLPYALVEHTHEREVTSQLGHPVFFMPHVASFFRGLTVTTSVTFVLSTTRARLVERFAAFYAGEPLVTLSDEAPLVRDAVGRHSINVGGLAVSADGLHAVVVSTLDNLLGGAATHALRSLNLSMGFPELEGIAT
jgi:N-acetyl-gamma-glutamyl-phosphate reductase common form